MSAAAAAAAALNAQLVQLRRQSNRQAIFAAGNFADVAIPPPAASTLATGPLPPSCADICRTGSGTYPQLPLLPPTITYALPGSGSGTPIFYGVFSDATAFRPPQLIGNVNRPGLRLQ
jgi:hypothetical protein